MVKRKHAKSNRRSRNSSLPSSSPENQAVLQFAARYSCYASVKVPNEATLKSSRDRCPETPPQLGIAARDLGPIPTLVPRASARRSAPRPVATGQFPRVERRGISGDRLRHGDTRARPDTGICREETYVYMYKTDASE